MAKPRPEDFVFERDWNYHGGFSSRDDSVQFVVAQRCGDAFKAPKKLTPRRTVTEVVTGTSLKEVADARAYTYSRRFNAVDRARCLIAEGRLPVEGTDG